jgi:hypothetical protein
LARSATKRYTSTAGEVGLRLRSPLLDLLDPVLCLLDGFLKAYNKGVVYTTVNAVPPIFAGRAGAAILAVVAILARRAYRPRRSYWTGDRGDRVIG